MALTALHFAAAVSDLFRPQKEHSTRDFHTSSDDSASVTCFMDFQADGISKGRVVFRLDTDHHPKARKNFLALCTGDQENFMDKKLDYKGTQIHGIYPGEGIIVGGDIVNGNGTGGESIFGPFFKSEEPLGGFEIAGSLGMVHWEPDTNHSQFFISVNKQDKDAYPTNVSLGRVISGMEILKELLSYGQKSGLPTAQVIIENCGRL